MMNLFVKNLIIFICVTSMGFSLKGQSTFKEVLAESKGLKVPVISDKLIGNKIFEFDGNTYEGTHLNNDSIQGEVSVLNFWFIGCPPCIAEMKGLNEIVSKFESEAAEKVNFISFVLDDKVALETTFFSKREFNFQVIPDCINFLMFDLESPFGYPTTFVIDKKGIIRKIVSGSSRDEEEATIEIKEKLIPIIEKLINET